MCDVGQPHEHKDFGFLVGAPEIRALVDDTRRLTAEIPDTAARGGRAASGEYPNVSKPITLSGGSGDDAKRYQVRAVERAIKESTP